MKINMVMVKTILHSAGTQTLMSPRHTHCSLTKMGGLLIVKPFSYMADYKIYLISLLQKDRLKQSLYNSVNFCTLRPLKNLVV